MSAIQEPGDFRFRTLRSPVPPVRVRPSLPARRMWRDPALLFWVGIGATVILLACLSNVIPGVALWGRFDMLGSYSLTKGVTELAATGDCQGHDAYGDIAEGTPVTVYDAEGTELGKGALADSFHRNGACFFHFTVRNVPSGHDFYQVEVSQRGKLTVADDDARSGVVFSLG